MRGAQSLQNLTDKKNCPCFFSTLFLPFSLFLPVSSTYIEQERQAEWILRDFDAAGAVPVSVLLNYLRAELAVSFSFSIFPSRSSTRNDDDKDDGDQNLFPFSVCSISVCSTFSLSLSLLLSPSSPTEN